ncbi:MAG: ATP-dependent Clp protease proteolytic subunit [Puniceicoccales bacterium]|jgi:ATP-dependent Clp protease protease subunit|nr:ATP-dependent Clp protease proteolytic subunit [Puniceicoccales bacterium]
MDKFVCKAAFEEEGEDGEGKQSSCNSMMQKRFLRERKIFLWGEVNDKSAKDITEKLLYLEIVEPNSPIDFFINTPGGSITAGMAVYDTMKLIKSPIRVVVTGLAASMGSILLCGTKRGNRLLYPNARVLIHQPLIMGQIAGPAVDINIQANEMEKTRNELNRILAESSGQPIEKITKDTDRDFYMNAREAIEYGLADQIVAEI